MIKTGKRTGFIGSVLLTLLFYISGFAQNITVDASLSETNIFSGESVRFEIKISGESLNSIERPKIPSIDGLRWLSGSTSQSQNFTYINGRPSITYSYGYQFIAQAPGEYTFPSLSVFVNTEKYETPELRFKVLDPKTIDTGEAQRSPDIYVRLEPSTTNPVVGEQVIANIVLYFKNEVEVSSYNPSPGWKAEGFWKEDLNTRQQASTTSTIINGVRYKRANLQQYAIFPTKSGELTISPYEIVVQVRKRNQRRDIFSFGLGQERMELNTLPVTLNVDPLPELNNAEFSGAVGNFRISRSVEPREAFVGESIEIITTISGEGNIPLIVKPEYVLPETLELYDPQESTNITRNNRQIGGSKTFTDIVIARTEGSFIIPEVEMAYYNPGRKAYSTVTLPAVTINAKRDPESISASAKELRLDVQPITGLANWTSARHIPLTQREWVWVLMVLPLLVLGGAYGYKRYADRMNTDTAFARAQKAKENALAELESAKGNDDLKSGYYHIQKALYQFIADKLNLPRAGLSTRKLVEELKVRVGTATAAEVKKLLDKCETIAYAPNATQAGLEADIRKAEELIKTIGKLT